jgi:broad specificity phosphatase PhoE
MADIVEFDDNLATVGGSIARHVSNKKKLKRFLPTIPELNRLYFEIRTLEHTPFYVGRHGMTQDDVDKKWSGWEPIGLTPEGAAAVAQSARVIRPLGIKRVVCSHLLRAKQTAQIYADILGSIPVVEDIRLAAWNLGILAGQLESHDAIAPYIESPWTKVPNGESLNAWKIRFIAGMQDAENKNFLVGPTLVISHSSGLCIWEGGGDLCNCTNDLQPAAVALSNGYGKPMKLIVGDVFSGDAA